MVQEIPKPNHIQWLLVVILVRATFPFFAVDKHLCQWCESALMENCSCCQPYIMEMVKSEASLQILILCTTRSIPPRKTQEIFVSHPRS